MSNRRLLTAAAVLAASLLLPARALLAEEGEIPLQHSGTDIKDLESLRRGARSFMNYCSGCHSLAYLRYNRMAEDLKIPDAELKKDYMLTSNKVFDGIVSAMPADAAAWFGKQPPDLSLVARSRGVDYVYSFLKGFYVDGTRPWGVNNLYLPSAAMPDVLAVPQGLQKPVFENQPDPKGNAHMVLVGSAALTPGALSPKDFDALVRDITNFLDYAAEPVKSKREALGVYVMLFLLVGFVLVYFLKKEYWKDVH